MPPAAHAREGARRPTPCSDPRPALPPPNPQGFCIRGDNCPYSHGVFECWLHPSRYRTQLCKDGSNCHRPVCFFAHSLPELRTPSYTWLPGPEDVARCAAGIPLPPPTASGSAGGAHNPIVGTLATLPIGAAEFAAKSAAVLAAVAAEGLGDAGSAAAAAAAAGAPNGSGSSADSEGMLAAAASAGNTPTSPAGPLQSGALAKERSSLAAQAKEGARAQG